MEKIQWFCALFLFLVNAHDYDYEDEDGCVRLYRGGNANEYSGRQGIVQVKQNGTWNFVNGSDWDYRDAHVVCRELGYQGVAAFNTTDTTYTIPSHGYELRFQKFLPGVVKGLQCLGSEEKLGKCLMKAATLILPTKILAYPPGFPFRVPNVAWVSCSAGHGTNGTYGEPLDSNSTASSSSENARKETNHPPSPVAAAVVFSILGTIIVVAVVVTIIGVVHKHSATS